jgi:plasmid maintenance system killer protein
VFSESSSAALCLSVCRRCRNGYPLVDWCCAAKGFGAGKHAPTKKVANTPRSHRGRMTYFPLRALSFVCRTPRLRAMHCRPAANRLEALKNDRKGQHSMRINDRWRI